MPVSLKEPVGFMPWCLASSQSRPRRAGGARELVERRVALAEGDDAGRSATMGSRSRKRQTPDWSTARVEVRRSCQS